MEKQINKTLVENTLTDILNNIFENAKVPMGKAILSKTQNSAIRHKHKNYDVIINVSPLFENNKTNTISEQDFVDMVWSCFHEEEHLYQNYIFQQPTCTDEIRHMAHTELLHISIPETYQSNDNSGLAGYWHNINEIDAETYGLQKTRIFFQQNFPEIDIDTHLIQLIKNKTVWYAANRNIKTIDDAFHNLNIAKQESYHKPILLPIRYIQNKYSPGLKKFIANDIRRQNYIQAYDNQDGQTCTQLLLNFIKENQPWRYKKFPCLQDEWTDEIRNAEPPTFAKLRKLNRITQLEELYGHLLDQQNMDTNDTPNYEP